jgi:hypothetical protein
LTSTGEALSEWNPSLPEGRISGIVSAAWGYSPSAFRPHPALIFEGVAKITNLPLLSKSPTHFFVIFFLSIDPKKVGALTVAVTFSLPLS